MEAQKKKRKYLRKELKIRVSILQTGGEMDLNLKGQN